MSKEIKLTRGMVAVVDDDDYDWLSKWSWCAHKHKGKYYAERGIRERGTCFQKTIRMNREILSAPDCFQVDHIDGDSLNNQKHNLRVCTDSQNKFNRGVSKRNKSGYKGVHWNAQRKKWCASIQENKNKFVLGFFEESVDAAKAYDEAAKKHHGRFAVLNFPEGSA